MAASEYDDYDYDITQRFIHTIWVYIILIILHAFNSSNMHITIHVKHAVLFIGKGLAEDRRSCHQLPVGPMAVMNLLILKNM